MRYILRRFMELLPVLFGVSILIFGLNRVAPTDPALLLLGQEATEQELERLRHSFGLDQPLPAQYIRWISKALRGDFGNSYLYGNPITEEITARLPATVQLSLSGVFVTIAIGIPLGILSATKHGRWIDQLSLVGSLVGVSTPVFLLGFLFIWFLSYKIQVFPTSGWGTLRHLVLPALTIGLPAAAIVTRLTRTAMLEVLRQDYIRTAQAKGLKQQIVLVRHALRNALIPVVTIVGLQFGFLLNGSIIVEQVFAWPGIGSLMVNAASLGDFAVIQGATLLFTVMFVLVNLTVDFLYGVLDPRVRLDKKGG